MYFYYKRQLKILHNELYGKIDEIDPIGKMHKSFKNVFITDMVFMILTSLIAMYFYYWRIINVWTKSWHWKNDKVKGSDNNGN